MLKHYLQTALRNLWRFKFATAANVLCLAFGFTCFMCAYVVASWLTESDSRFVDADRSYAIGNGSLALFDQLKTDYPKIPMTAYFVPSSQMEVFSDETKNTSVTVLVTDSEFSNLYRLTAVSGTMSLTGATDILISEALSKTLLGETSAVGKRLLLGKGVSVTVSGVYKDLAESSALSIRWIDSLGTDRTQFAPQLVMTNAIADRLGIDNQLMPPLPGARAKNLWLEGRVIYFSLPESSVLSSRDIGKRASDYLGRFSANANPKASLLSANQLVAHERQEMFTKLADTKSPMGLLLVIGMVVVGVAIANYANLYTTQSLVRSKDNGLRQLLGATRIQMLSYCLLDAFLLCVVAMCMSISLLPLCNWVLGLSQYGLNLSQRMQLDWSAIFNTHIFLVSVGFLIAMTLLSAAYPIYVLSRVQPMDAIRQSSLTYHGLFAKLLVGLQFMTASALLIGLIVMQWQGHELKRATVGGQGGQLVILNNKVMNGVDGFPIVSSDGVNAATPIDGTFNAVKSELLRHRQVLDVSWVDVGLWGASNTFMSVHKDPTGDVLMPFMVYSVSDNFLSMMEFKLLAGRWLDISRDSVMPDPEAERRLPGPGAGGMVMPVSDVLVDRDLVNKLGWSDPKQAVGQLIYGRPTGGVFVVSGPGGVMLGKVPDDRYRIVGVIDGPPLTTSGTYPKLFRLAATQANMVGLRSDLYAVIRIDKNDIAGSVAAIKDTIKKLAPNVVPNYSFADETFAKAFSRYQLLTNSVTILASIAFFISIMSMVGMAAHALNRRRHEVGIRKSLGASTLRVFCMLLSDFSKPVLWANILVWPIAYIAMNAYLGIFTYRISLNAWPFVTSLLITVIIAWLAVLIQTRRVARLRPSEVLRYE